MKYVDCLISIVDGKTGPVPKCSCGWTDYPFYKRESAWHSALLHLAYDFRHANNPSTRRWALSEIGKPH